MVSERDRETARVIAKYGRQVSEAALRASIADNLEQARAEEREVCRRLVEAEATKHWARERSEAGVALDHVAAAIRARGEG